MDFGNVLNSLLFFPFTPCPMQFCLAPLNPASPNVPRSSLCLTYWKKSGPGLRDLQQHRAFILPCPPPTSTSSGLLLAGRQALLLFLCLASCCSPPPGWDQILPISSPRCFTVPPPFLCFSYHCHGSDPTSLLGQKDFLLVAVTSQPPLTQSCLVAFRKSTV